MSSTSKPPILRNLAKQLITQSSVIDALCDILITKKIVTEKELNSVIDEYLLDQADYFDDLIDSQGEEEIEPPAIYYGPIGEA